MSEMMQYSYLRTSVKLAPEELGVGVDLYEGTICFESEQETLRRNIFVGFPICSKRKPKR